MQIHIDPLSGISGDMFLAACLDLGLEQQPLLAALQSIPLPEWSLAAKTQRRGGLAGLHITFATQPEHKHRHLSDIFRLIDHSGLEAAVKTLAKKIFETLAIAEGKVHGIASDKIHFHEVGAVDAILDICGAAFAIHHLNFTQVTASPVPVGQGTVNCDHGQMPIPVPAVAELFRSHNVPIRPDPTPMELVTPTGAAILVNLVESFDVAKLTRIDRVGIGLGSREIPGRANMLRILAQESRESSTTGYIQDQIIKLSSNLDDMNPEWYPPLIAQLFDAGALDVAMLPITMKHGRPGVCLEVLAIPSKQQELVELLLKNSTTLGVRLELVTRLTLARKMVAITTPWGTIAAKRAGDILRIEHRDLLRIAQENSWSLPQAQQQLYPYLTG